MNVLEKFEYLTRNRKITSDTIKKFEIIHYVNDKFLTHSDSPTSSVFFPFITDRYKDSIVFPIRDDVGNPYGIIARLFNGKPKYLNTGVSKGKILYGFHETYKNILKKNCAFVVEGPVDFLLCFQYNLDNVVSVLGSHMTFDQVCLLASVTENVVLIPDGDSAGKESGIKNLNLVRKHGLNCEIFELPKGMDPDEYIIKFGTKELKKYEERFSKSVLQKT